MWARGAAVVDRDGGVQPPAAHGEVGEGLDEDAFRAGEPERARAAVEAEYPEKLCKLIAERHVHAAPRMDRKSGAEAVAEGAMAAA